MYACTWKKNSVFPKRCIYDICKVLTINCDYSCKQNQRICICDEALCLFSASEELMYFYVRWKLSVADMVPFKAIQLTQVAKLWKPHDLMEITWPYGNHMTLWKSHDLVETTWPYGNHMTLWKSHDLMKTELCNYHFLMFCAPCILVIIFVQNTK